MIQSPVVATIARWFKTLMEKLELTFPFKAHSVRGDAGSKAAGAAWCKHKGLDVADWLSESTFQRFYYRELRISDRSTFWCVISSNFK